MLSLLIPAFSLLLRPYILSIILHPHRMLLYHYDVSNNIHSPVYFLLGCILFSLHSKENFLKYTLLDTS